MEQYYVKNENGANCSQVVDILGKPFRNYSTVCKFSCSARGHVGFPKMYIWSPSLHGGLYGEAKVKIWWKSVKRFKSYSNFSKILKVQNGAGGHLGFRNSSFWHNNIVVHVHSTKFVKFDCYAISSWKVIKIFVFHRKCIGSTKNCGFGGF